MPKIKNFDKFKVFINCLFGSWGGDTPAEVYWAAEDLLLFLEEEYDVIIINRFDESKPENVELVLEELQKKLG